MVRVKQLSVVPALLLASTSAGMATTLTAQNILDQFNAVVFNTFSTSADVEGRVVVGQSMTGGASIYINPNNTQASVFSALTVYGNQSGTGTMNVNNGGGHHDRRLQLRQLHAEQRRQCLCRRRQLGQHQRQCRGRHRRRLQQRRLRRPADRYSSAPRTAVR